MPNKAYLRMRKTTFLWLPWTTREWWAFCDLRRSHWLSSYSNMYVHLLLELKLGIQMYVFYHSVGYHVFFRLLCPTPCSVKAVSFGKLHSFLYTTSHYLWILSLDHYWRECEGSRFLVSFESSQSSLENCSMFKNSLCASLDWFCWDANALRRHYF